MNIFKAAVIYLFIFKLLPLKISNVYNYLWRHYGASITKHYSEYVKAHIKLNKLKYDLQFLRTCKRENLLPNFTKIRLANPALYNTKLIHQCRLNILQAELKFKKKIFTQTYKHTIRLKNELRNYVPHWIFVRLQTIMNQIVLKKNIQVQIDHEIKLRNLRYPDYVKQMRSFRSNCENINYTNMNHVAIATLNRNNNRIILATHANNNNQTLATLANTIKERLTLVTVINDDKKLLRTTENDDGTIKISSLISNDNDNYIPITTHTNNTLSMRCCNTNKQLSRLSINKKKKQIPPLPTSHVVDQGTTVTISNLNDKPLPRTTTATNDGGQQYPTTPTTTMCNINNHNNNNNNWLLTAAFQEDNFEYNFKLLSSTKFHIAPVTNLSGKDLTHDEIYALQHGLHHVYPSDNINQAEYVCCMENFFAALMNVQTSYQHYQQKHEQDKILHQLTSTQLDVACEIRTISNMINKKATKEVKKLGMKSRPIVSIIKQLANDPTLVITKPDKGRGVVILKKVDYIKKMESILDDKSTFQQIDHDPTYNNENRLSQFLLKLKNNNFITEHEYYVARPTGSRPARIYGLPKLHKANHLLRPVMSATKTVAYGLGKILTNRLYQMRKSPYVVKNSADFVNRIKQSMNTDKLMVSFDVISLFTNIPLEYTINLILNEMYPECTDKCFELKRGKKQKKKTICKQCQRRKDFHILLNTATSEVNFLFNNKMYLQRNGVAMGAPIAPVIADIFMSHLEMSVMDRLKENGIHEYYRYVDDTFTLIEPTANIQNILDILNKFNESIKFTHEIEKENSLWFLEVKVFRSLNKNRFETTIHRKSTYTGLMINFHSFVPTQYKKAALVNVIQRSIAVCSTYKALIYEFEHIRKVAIANSYPIGFIEQHISKGFNKYIQMQQQPHTERTTIMGCEKRKVFFELPYVGNTTELLKKRLANVIMKSIPATEPHFYVRTQTAIHRFFKQKDPINKLLQSDVVYRIECQDCDEFYIGKTERQLIRRFIEHGAPKEILNELVINNPQYIITETTTTSQNSNNTRSTVNNMENKNEQYQDRTIEEENENRDLINIDGGSSRFISTTRNTTTDPINTRETNGIRGTHESANNTNEFDMDEQGKNMNTTQRQKADVDHEMLEQNDVVKSHRGMLIIDEMESMKKRKRNKNTFDNTSNMVTMNRNDMLTNGVETRAMKRKRLNQIKVDNNLLPIGLNDDSTNTVDDENMTDVLNNHEFKRMDGIENRNGLLLDQNDHNINRNIRFECNYKQKLKRSTTQRNNIDGQEAITMTTTQDNKTISPIVSTMVTATSTSENETVNPTITTNLSMTSTTTELERSTSSEAFNTIAATTSTVTERTTTKDKSTSSTTVNDLITRVENKSLTTATLPTTTEKELLIQKELYATSMTTTKRVTTLARSMTSTSGKKALATSLRTSSNESIVSKLSEEVMIGNDNNENTNNKFYSNTTTTTTTPAEARTTTTSAKATTTTTTTESAKATTTTTSAKATTTTTTPAEARTTTTTTPAEATTTTTPAEARTTTTATASAKATTTTTSAKATTTTTTPAEARTTTTTTTPAEATTITTPAEARTTTTPAEARTTTTTASAKAITTITTSANATTTTTTPAEARTTTTTAAPLLNAITSIIGTGKGLIASTTTPILDTTTTIIGKRKGQKTSTTAPILDTTTSILGTRKRQTTSTTSTTVKGAATTTALILCDTTSMTGIRKGQMSTTAASVPPGKGRATTTATTTEEVTATVPALSITTSTTPTTVPGRGTPVTTSLRSIRTPSITSMETGRTSTKPVKRTTIKTTANDKTITALPIQIRETTTEATIATLPPLINSMTTTTATTKTKVKTTKRTITPPTTSGKQATTSLAVSGKQITTAKTGSQTTVESTTTSTIPIATTRTAVTTKTKKTTPETLIGNDKTNNEMVTSAIKRHTYEKQHRINWRDAKVVWTDNNPRKLLIKESMLIKAYEPEMNRTTHSVPLYIYSNGLDKQFLPKCK